MDHCCIDDVGNALRKEKRTEGIAESKREEAQQQERKREESTKEAAYAKEDAKEEEGAAEETNEDEQMEATIAGIDERRKRHRKRVAKRQHRKPMVQVS